VEPIFLVNLKSSYQVNKHTSPIEHIKMLPKSGSNSDLLLLGLTGSASPAAPLRLKRTLGALDLTLIGIGASIGSGIFVLSGVALKEAGPGVWLSFVVAAAVCSLDALCYAELASRFPTSGGAYLFTKQVFGNPAALVVGLNLLFDYHIGAAAIARSFAGYLGNVLETLPDTDEKQVGWVEAVPVSGLISLNVVAPVLLALLTAVLCRGASESATLNRVLTGTKLLTIFVVIGAGCTVVDRSLWSPAFPKGYFAIVFHSIV
jgi:APA family basic amino acid/polyamine antiporter